MTDEILGRNPLEARDSIWKIPEPKNSEENPPRQEPEDDLDFPDPLANIEESESIIPTTPSAEQEVPSEERATPVETESPFPTEESDYFEIPDYAEEALSEEEQDVLLEEVSFTNEFSEDFKNAVDTTEEQPPEEEQAERAIDEAPEYGFLENVSIQELSPILSEGTNPSSLGFEAHLAEDLAELIKETLPRDEESAALFEKFGNAPSAPTPATQTIPVQETYTVSETLPAVIEEGNSFPEQDITESGDIHVDETTLNKNLANMVTLEDLIFTENISEGVSERNLQPSAPITLDDLHSASRESSGFALEEYIIAKDLPVPVPASKPAVSSEMELAVSNFRKNEEDDGSPKAMSDTYASIIQLVGFKLDTEHFGIDIMQIQEIIRLQDVTPVPRSANFILGVLNLRGKVIPIIDLRRRFSLPKASATPQTRIIIVTIDVGTIGFVVDEVMEVIRLPKTAMEAAPATATNINAEYIKGVGHLGELGEDLLIILDLDKVLTREKKELVEELM